LLYYSFVGLGGFRIFIDFLYPFNIIHGLKLILHPKNNLNFKEAKISKWRFTM